MVLSFKRYIVLSFLFIILLVPLTGCGVSQSDYDAVVTERDKLKADYDQLVADTSDWLQLTEVERSAQLAQAEADRIVAEEKAAAEQKAAEEQIAKESVSIQEVLVNPLIYNAQFVRITNDLKITGNEVDRKSFRAYLSTGPKKYDYDTDFYIEVFYSEMADWKTYGTMSVKDNPLISVAGTFYLYSNSMDKGYILASEIKFLD